MRSYRQRCGLAKALDVIGDRWSLLIVREILIRGACRYTDLQRGLPGIATNLLADRLRELQSLGVLSAVAAPAPIATTLFDVTERGRQLEVAVALLSCWGEPLSADASKREPLQPHWIVLPLKLYAQDNTPEAPAITVELRVDGEFITVTAGKGAVDVRLGRVPAPTAVLTGTASVILDFFSGRKNLAQALAAGMADGADLAAILRVIPRGKRDIRANHTGKKNVKTARPEPLRTLRD